MLLLVIITFLYSNRFFIISIILYIIICIIYIIECNINIKKNYEVYHSSSSKIPSVIYTYWNDANRIPNTVVKCIDSWKKWNPDYTIHIITNDNIQSYIPFDLSLLRHADTPQRTSDFIRLYLLSTHGGIWMDATVYLSKSLDWVHGYQTSTECEFVGYILDEDSPRPNVESWFLACVPGSTFINDWKQQFFKLTEYETIESYIEMVEQTTNLSDIGYNKNYLSIYVASQYILQKPNQCKLKLVSSITSLHSFKLFYFFPPSFYIMKQYPIIKWTYVDRTMMEMLHLHSFL